MIRKWFCLLCVLVMMCGTTGEAEASETSGTVQIVPQWCGTPLTEGAIALRRIGIKKNAEYYLTDGLANWSVDAEEMESLTTVDWLLEKTFEEEKIVRIEDDEGVVFTGLAEGVYLVRQVVENGAPSFASFMLTIPEGKSWEVIRRPQVISHTESPKTADRPAPIIGAMGLGLSVAVLMVLVDERKK